MRQQRPRPTILLLALAISVSLAIVPHPASADVCFSDKDLAMTALAKYYIAPALGLTGPAGWLTSVGIGGLIYKFSDEEGFCVRVTRELMEQGRKRIGGNEGSHHSRDMYHENTLEE